MKLMTLLEKGKKMIDDHQREIMLGGAIAGVVITAVTAWKAGAKADALIEKHRDKLDRLDAEFKDEDIQMTEDEYKSRKKDLVIDAVKEIGPVVIPPVIAASGTIISVVGGYKVASKQIAVLSSLYSMSKEALSDYQDKAKELLGAKKAQEITDKISADKVLETPPKTDTVINTGHGQVLCKDDYTGHYFYSEPEYIRKCINDINEQLRDEYFVSLNDFYEELGLPNCKLGNDIGFCMDDGYLRVSFSFTGAEIGGRDNIPCLVLNYDVSPKYGFGDCSAKFGGNW